MHLLHCPMAARWARDQRGYSQQGLRLAAEGKRNKNPQRNLCFWLMQRKGKRSKGPLLGLGDFYLCRQRKSAPKAQGQKATQLLPAAQKQGRQKATQLMPSFAFDCSTFACDYPLLLT